jgi:putative tRNA adenosine deaminase-associated protein
VSYFAAVFARTEQGWVGAQADLADAEGADDLADLMREVAVETEGDPVLLLVEEDDEWFAIMRLDGEDDPQAFVSDARALAGRLAGLLAHFAQDVPDGEEHGGVSGNAALLEDLGVDAKRLLELSDRAMPGDALLVVAEETGFAEEFDRLRD